MKGITEIEDLEEHKNMVRCSIFLNEVQFEFYRKHGRLTGLGMSQHIRMARNADMEGCKVFDIHSFPYKHVNIMKEIRENE